MSLFGIKLQEKWFTGRNQTSLLTCLIVSFISTYLILNSKVSLCYWRFIQIVFIDKLFYLCFSHLIFDPVVRILGFPSGPVIKNPPANAGESREEDSIPGSGRSFGLGKGNTLQYSCLENFMTEQPGRLQLMGSQRVIYDWVNTHISLMLNRAKQILKLIL